MTDAPTYTLVSFHAHPDDESLLTGGTLAKAAEEGHRVVLVTATRGDRGLAGPQDGHGRALAGRRMDELAVAAQALGCARVETLGYGDSGLHPSPGDVHAFANADVEEAARRLAGILVAERADVLTTYDPNGGYGHPDHVMVHHVGRRAAELAATPVVLEATVPAALFRAVLGALRVAGRFLGSAPLGTRGVFSARGDITHRVRVTAQLPAKRAGLEAHASQARAAGQARVLAHVLRLPSPLFTLAFGTEWYVERGRPRGRRSTDVFAGLGPPAARGGP